MSTLLAMNSSNCICQKPSLNTGFFPENPKKGGQGEPVFDEGRKLVVNKRGMFSRVFQNAQKSKDLRGWLAKYVVIHN